MIDHSVKGLSLTTPMGFEPTLFAVTGRCFYQLNYGAIYTTFQHICTSKLTAPHFLTIGMCTSDGKLHHLSLCCKILIKDSNLGFRVYRRTSYYTNKRNKIYCSRFYRIILVFFPYAATYFKLSTRESSSISTPHADLPSVRRESNPHNLLL